MFEYELRFKRKNLFPGVEKEISFMKWVTQS